MQYAITKEERALEKTASNAAGLHDWQWQLRNAFRTAESLAQRGWIPQDSVTEFQALLQRYPVLITPYYAGLIDGTDPACPIRAQAIPRLEENRASEAAQADPLNDLQHRPASRITHRYRHRLLLHLTPNCSMNCRYCFRKTLLGEQRPEFFDGQVFEALEYIRTHTEINEVILSGGDPFLANEATLSSVLKMLDGLDHVHRVRFHTRVPVTLPMRVSKDFAELLSSHRKKTVTVTHFNHPKEITPEAVRAIGHLKEAGHTVLNQSVLLSGVNDGVHALCRLSEDLFSAGVLPYYLHHPDRALGTLHFDVTKERGLELYGAIRERLPGYLVPKYVFDDGANRFKRGVGEPQ
jgi:KamA family protein